MCGKSINWSLALSITLGLACLPAIRLCGQTPLVQTYLINGNLNQGEKELKKILLSDPHNDAVRFELGALQFFQTVEHLGQSFHKYGLTDNFQFISLPFLRMPVPANEDPEPVTLSDVRRTLQTVIDDLTEADQTLAKVQAADVKLPLQLFQFHLDFDNDGKCSPDEKLTPIYREYLGGNWRRGNNQIANFDQIVVVFDRSDVDWLRGYCCLLRALCEVVLAYDQSDLWDVAGHRFFGKPVLKNDFLLEETRREQRDWNNSIMDLIAAIHNMRFRLMEPERMKKAHQYLLQTIAHSRSMWQLVNLETDNDREWIPSPKQVSAINNVRITNRMTQTWGHFLDESEALLKGRKLVPFWRGTNPKRGLNLNKVFLQPSDIDVVLWVHGSGVVPYLEEGDVTSEETWRQFQDVFGGEFFGFAIWFN